MPLKKKEMEKKYKILNARRNGINRVVYRKKYYAILRAISERERYND